MLGQPDVLIHMVSSYFPDPWCHFYFKSTCMEFHKLLSPEYSFRSLSHLLSFSERSSRGGPFRAYNIGFHEEIDIGTLRRMIILGITMSLIIPLISQSSTVGLMEGILSDSLFTDFVFYHATVTGNLLYSFEVIRRRLERYPRNRLSLDWYQAAQVCKKLASCGTEYHIIFLFSFFGDTFVQSHAEEIVNKIVLRGMQGCILLFHGLGVNLNQSRNGMFPLQAAIQSGKHEVLDLLLRMNIKLKIRYRHGQYPPMHLACMQEDRFMIEKLLAHGASVSERDFYGHTPLHVINRKIRFGNQRKPSHARMDELLRIRKLLVSRA
jgi:ankyrin repeat protein